MRFTLCGAVLACALQGTAVRADAPPEAKAILDKGIQAIGGEAKLAKLKAFTVKSKGKFYGLGQAINYTAEAAGQPPSQSFSKVDSEINGMSFTFIQIINGDKGWIRLMDSTMEMPKEALTEQQEEMYTGWISTLLPLREPAFKLSLLGESKVLDRACVGLQVAHPGHRDVSLYFDKESGLLRKTERRVKEQQGQGPEVTQEMFYDDYKAVEGIQRAFKLIAKRDGKDYLESEMTEFKPLEKLDDSVFGRP